MQHAMFQSTDPIEDNSRQEPLSLIRSDILDILKYGEEGTIISDVVEDTSLNDIHIYMKKLEHDQDLKVKLPMIKSYKVEDEDSFNMLVDHVSMKVGSVELPYKFPQRVYFIESADFAITFIPIQLNTHSDKGPVAIYFQPLEDSPKFINEMWLKTKKKTGKEALDGIKFVDLRNKGD